MPQTLSPVGYCRKCGYDLNKLTSGRCPECGRDFDPKDPRTIRRRPKRVWLRRLVKWVCVPVLLLGLGYGGLLGWLYMGWKGEAEARRLAYKPSHPLLDCGGVDHIKTAPILPASLHWMLPLRCRPWLARVEELDLERFRLQPNENIGEVLARCHQLKTLGLNVRVRSQDVRAIARINSLRSLTIGGTLQKEDIQAIAGLRSLTSLCLGPELPAADLAPLGEMSNLEDLTLIQKFPLDDQIMTAIARLRKLKSLHVTPNNEITDGGLDALAQLPNLQHLDVGSARLTDGAVEKLCRLQGLASLDLYYTNLSGDAIGRIRAAMPKCAVTGPRRL